MSVAGRYLSSFPNSRTTKNIKVLSRFAKSVPIGRVKLNGALSYYLLLDDNFDKDHRSQLSRILFAAIISSFKRGKTEGELELRIRCNGGMKKTWEDTKMGNPMLRTSGSHRSARHTITQTTFCSEFPLKSAIPPAVRRPFQSPKPHSALLSHSRTLA